jgi:hypothetical protein
LKGSLLADPIGYRLPYVMRLGQLGLDADAPLVMG